MATGSTSAQPPRSSSRTSTKFSSATLKISKPNSKRVRVIEPEEEIKLTKLESIKVDKKGKKVNEKKDLKDKELNQVIEIISAQVEPPMKGIIKKLERKSETELMEEEIIEIATQVEVVEEEEEIDFLKGFESAEDGEDSSDEEMEDGKSTFDESKLPKVAKDTTVQTKLEPKEKKKGKTGTIYLGRVPHGFHEEEMKSYFSQFGEVTRIRLSRNKKTGASKHYAFLEFAYSSVAQIVQETMDNYLLAGHILVCKIVPEEEVHPKLWIGANRVFRVIPKGRRDALIRAAPKTEEQKASISAKLLKKEEAKRVKLAALGINYEFSGYAEKVIEVPLEAVVEVKATKAVKGKKEKVVKEKVVKEKKEKVVKEKKTSEPAKKKARKSM